MVHACRIKDGKLYYCNRYLQTPKLQYENSKGCAIRLRVGEMDGKIGMFKMFLLLLQGSIGYVNPPEQFKAGTANTAFAHHSRRTYALYEVDYPFHIKIDRSQK